MDETGQPGAATPEEHGQGPGQHDDLSRTGGWAPRDADWSGGGRLRPEPAPPQWHQPDQAGGWGSSSPRYHDLPAPVPGMTAAAAPAAANGRARNGFDRGEPHPAEHPPTDLRAPVSAPPAAGERDHGHPTQDRVRVPLQRPAPDEPAAGPATAEEGVERPRHVQDERSGAAGQWRDDAAPASAPPAPSTGGGHGFGFRASDAYEPSRPDPAATAPSGRWDQPPYGPPGDHEPTAPGSGVPAPSAPDPGPLSEPAGRRSAEPPHGPAPSPEAGPERPRWPGEATSWTPGTADRPAGRRARVDDRSGWPDEPPTGPPSSYPVAEPPPADPPARPAEPTAAPPTPAATTSVPDRNPWTPPRRRAEESRAESGPAGADERPTVPPAPADRREAGRRAAPAAEHQPSRGADPVTGDPLAAPGRAPAGEPGTTYTARRAAPEPEEETEPPSPAAASGALPQRVPSRPDVPPVAEPPAVEPPAAAPELARIATHLRREEEPSALRDRPEGFDVEAILAAVHDVPGVRDAMLRTTPAGAHSLRLELAEGADPAEVSRQVARLLQERMGLVAAPRDLADAAPETAAPPAPVRAEPEDRPEAPGRRRRQGPTHRHRAPGVDRARPIVADPGYRGAASLPGPAVGVAAPAAGTAYSGAQVTTTEAAPSRPLNPGGAPGPRVVIDHVQLSTFGLDATVEVRLVAAGERAAGVATGPAVDGYVLRLAAAAAASAVDQLLGAERGRCFVEHAAVVPFGNCEVATVVVLLVCDGWVEQLAGSALVAGDPRQAVVRATLAAVNRRLEALLG